MEEDEMICEEEIWSRIRYLDPDEQRRDSEGRIVTIIATFALLLVFAGVWILLWVRVGQP